MFWRFFIKLLIADFLVVFVFSFALVAIISPFALLGKATESHPRLAAAIAIPLGLLAAVFQFFFWGGWSAFCVALAEKYVSRPETSAH